MPDRLQIDDWIAQVRDDTPQAASARTALLALGKNTVPALIDAVETELRRSRGLILSYGPLIRLIELLLEFPDPRTFPVLLRLSTTSLPVPQLAQRVAGLLRQMERMEPGSTIPFLLYALAECRTNTGHASLAIEIGETLVRIAARDPKPELRAALPLLLPGINTPFAFFRIRAQLKKRLKGTGLPIPAHTDALSGDRLPLPAQPEESSP